MRDALGGTVTLVIVILFIVIGLGYLAFNINYTKAFRLKDKIISLYNENDGECNEACKEQIHKYADEIGYATGSNFSCPLIGEKLYMDPKYLYCTVTHTISSGSDLEGDTKAKAYIEVATKNTLQIPIISNILDFKFFYINGDTRPFTVKG